MTAPMFINNDMPFNRHITSSADGLAFDDLLRSYTPYGAVGTISVPFRPGVGVGGYSGSADPYSLDHAISRQLELSGFQAGLDRQIYGGGKGLDLYGTLGSSIGEAVERMLGSFASLGVADGEGMMASYDQMVAAGRTCLGPDDFSYFQDSDFDEVGFLFQRWRKSTEVYWVSGRALLSGGTVWVPAQFVHLFHLMRTGETAVGISSSGGLATHLDLERAVSHAILELVERDAINLRWFSRLPPTRIDVDCAFGDRDIDRWMASAKRVGLDVQFYLQTVDIDEVFVVTAVAWDDQLEEWSYFAGGGAGLDITTTVRSAIAELIQAERMIRIPTLAPNWDLSWGIARMFGSAADMKPEEFSNFIQVVPYYGHRKNRHKLDWYFKPDDQKSVNLSECLSRTSAAESHHDEYELVLELCRRHGLEPVLFDLTPDTFDEVSLAKVVVTGLVPAFAPNTPLLGHPRYATIGSTLGVRDAPMESADFSTDPLPYP